MDNCDEHVTWTAKAVEQKIIEIIRAELLLPDELELTGATSVTADIAADSLDHLELILEVEEVFEVLLYNDEWHKRESQMLAKLDTVAEMAEMVMALLKAKK